MTDETTTTKPTTKPSPASKRTLSEMIGKRNPDNDAVLLEIAGKTVTIKSRESDQRQGKRRKYWVTNIELEDGRKFTVVGKGVSDPLSYLEAEDFPIEAVFTQEPSDFEPGAYYWTVN